MPNTRLDPNRLFSVNYSDDNFKTKTYNSGSIESALANVGIDYDDMANGSEIFEFVSQAMSYSEFAVAGGGGGDGDSLLSRLWKWATGKRDKGSAVSEEVILTGWEVDTEAIGDFVSVARLQT